MPRQRRASAGPDPEIVAVRLSADRTLDRLHHGGIAAIAAQHPLEIDRIRLPKARVQHARGSHTHAVAVLAEIVSHGRDETYLPAGFDHADVARWPAGSLGQIEPRPGAPE